jgi:hypothetical protein
MQGGNDGYAQPRFNNNQGGGYNNNNMKRLWRQSCSR